MWGCDEGRDQGVEERERPARDGQRCRLCGPEMALYEVIERWKRVFLNPVAVWSDDVYIGGISANVGSRRGRKTRS